MTRTPGAPSVAQEVALLAEALHGWTAACAHDIGDPPGGDTSDPGAPAGDTGEPDAPAQGDTGGVTIAGATDSAPPGPEDAREPAARAAVGDGAATPGSGPGCEQCGCAAPGVCAACPVCRAAGMLAILRPDTLNRLADLAAMVAELLRAAADGGRPSAPRPPTSASPARRRREREGGPGGAPDGSLSRAPVQDIPIAAVQLPDHTGAADSTGAGS